MTDYYPDPIKPWPGEPKKPKIVVDLKCPKCGLKFEGSVGYCCSHNDCPCFPKNICS